MFKLKISVIECLMYEKLLTFTKSANNYGVYCTLNEGQGGMRVSEGEREY